MTEDAYHSDDEILIIETRRVKFDEDIVVCQLGNGSVLTELETAKAVLAFHSSFLGRGRWHSGFDTG